MPSMNSAELIHYVTYFEEHFVNLGLVSDLNWPEYLEKDLEQQVNAYQKAARALRRSLFEEELFVNEIKRDIQCPDFKRCSDCIVQKINDCVSESMPEIRSVPENFRGLTCPYGASIIGSTPFTIITSYQILQKVFEFRSKLKYNNYCNINDNKEEDIKKNGDEISKD